MSNIFQLTDNATGFPVLMSAENIETVKGGANGAGPCTIVTGPVISQSEVVTEDLQQIQAAAGRDELFYTVDNVTTFPVLIGSGAIVKMLGAANGAGPVTITFNSTRTEVVTEDITQLAAKTLGTTNR